jgi:hypothetical protein
MESGLASFFGRDRVRKRLIPPISRLKPLTQRIFQSSNTKLPKQKIDDPRAKSKRILRHPRSVAYRRS